MLLGGDTMKKGAIFIISMMVLGQCGGLHAEPVQTYLPQSIVIDQAGNVLVTDTQNNRILLLKENEMQSIIGKESSIGGYVDDVANEAVFNGPIDITGSLKEGLYVSDSENNVIRLIKDKQVITYAGSGASEYKDGIREKAAFNCPMGLASDDKGNIFVADTLNHSIRVIDKAGKVTTLAGKGKAGYQDGKLEEALFNEPTDVILDKKGVVYVLDSGNQCIRKIENKKVTTLVGGDTELDEETGYKKLATKKVKVDEKDKKKVDEKAEGQEKPEALEEVVVGFNFPKSFIFANEETILVADTMNHAIKLVDLKGNVKTLIDESQDIMAPVGMAYQDGILMVAEKWDSGIKYFKVDLKNAKASPISEDALKSEKQSKH